MDGADDSAVLYSRTYYVLLFSFVTAISVLPHLSAATLPPARLFVSATCVDGAADPIPHVHPATGETVFQGPTADKSAVDAAVTAARAAFDDGPWPRLMGKDRARYLHKIAALIRADAANLNSLLSLDNSTPSSFVGFYQMGAEYPADVFDSYAGWVDKVTGGTYPQCEPTQPSPLRTHEP